MNSSTGTGGSSVSSSLLDGRPDKYTAGPILVQSFLQYLCQGVIISQSAKFYHRWTDDPIALRVYVVVLLVFSLLQTILESYKTWVETIVGKHWWTSNLHSTEFLCNAIICTICEAFLIRRCFRMTQRNVFVLAYLCVLLLVAIAASIALTVRIAQVIGPWSQGGMADPLHASMYAYPLWVFVTLVMALSLSTILSVSLWRTRTGLRHLDRTLNHIIFITFESAALPTACMLASAIIYSIRDAQGSVSFRPSPLLSPSPIPSPSPSSPSNSTSTSSSAGLTVQTGTLHLDLFFAILTGKVYTLGLLRTLNSRTQFRAGLHTSHLGRRSLTGVDWEAAHADARPSWVGSVAQGPRGEGVRCPAPTLGRGGEEGAGASDRDTEEGLSASEETVHESLSIDCDRVSLQSIPHAHYTTPKARKSFSRGSSDTPEHAGAWGRPR